MLSRKRKKLIKKNKFVLKNFCLKKRRTTLRTGKKKTNKQKKPRFLKQKKKLLLNKFCIIKKKCKKTRCLTLNYFILKLHKLVIYFKHYFTFCEGYI